MKAAWRLTEEQKPSDDREVIGNYSFGNQLIKFDGEYWYDTTSEIVVSEPLYWMHIPNLPNE